MVCECAATTRTRPDGGGGGGREAAERRMESRRSGGLTLHISLPPSRHHRGGRWGDGDPEACPGAWAQWEWGAGGTTLVPHTTQPETSHHGPACQARRFYGAWGSSSFRERTALFLLLF